MLVTTLMSWADGPFRNHRYDSFKVLAPKEGSILFIGNSITDMHCWPETFRTSTGEYLPIVNRGNSGTYSTEQCQNLESYLTNKPKKVFMMIGTNDLATSGGFNYLPEQILSQVKTIVERIHQRYPDTKIYLYSILNNNTSNRPAERWLKTNEMVKQYVDDQANPYLAYVDLYDKLTNVASGGQWSYDKLHLTAASYKVWTDAICSLLAEGEDYTVESVYPSTTATKQNNGGLGGANGMRATYASMLPIAADDILVFGDEMVKCGEWQELLGSPNVKNRGTGWGYGGSIDVTSKMVDATYANTGVDKADAKAIYLYTGTADANGTTDLATIKTNYKALVDKLVEKAPTSKIYLMGLCPTTNASNNTDRISVLNDYIKTLANDSQIRYIDLYTALQSGGTTNSRYFYPDNYLGGKGYVKVAQLMKEALDADFPDNGLTVITDAEADARYTAATQANADALKVMAMPKASQDETEYWYQITSLRSADRMLTAKGQAAGVVGEQNVLTQAASMWKFVKRSDNSYDIINHRYESYLSPTCAYNAQIQTVSAQPSQGWTLDYSNTDGYIIIASGDVQLNQTGSAQNFALYNWSNGNNKGNDKTDTGCQLQVSEAPDPVELPTTYTYTIDKLNGNLYNGNNANQNWNSQWRSTAQPQLTFGCGPDNMNWSGNNVQMMTGTATSAVYTITPPTGYVIEEYNFTFANNAHTTGLTLTMDDGMVYTTNQDAQTISASNAKLMNVSFTLSGSNGKGILLTDFTVKIKEDRPELPEISTEGNEHWYYIVSAAENDYCKGKAVYYDSDQQILRFDTKGYLADRVWSFWEQDGKIAIKNYRGEYFAKAGSGTGDGTKFGVQSTPNYIYTISEAYGAFIIKDDAVELHCQQSGSCIVRWNASAGNASLWTFEEVNAEHPEATILNTNVEQGKVTTGIGNKDQAIIRSSILVGGLEGACQLQAVKGKFVGTSKDDISCVKAYFASNAQELFVDADAKMTWREPNGTLYGEPVEIAENGTFTITGTKNLAPGKHYLWITYDIAEDAVEGHTVDATITGYTIDGQERTESNGNPQHAVTIFLSEGAVLMPMDKGSLYYRIPAITVTRDGKRLVTLTDDRKGHNTDLPAHCYLVAQYSEDNGRTWSDPVTVAGTATTGGDYGHGDASIVTNRDNGDIIGIMTSAGTYGVGFWASTANQPLRWKTITSHDGGLTWEAPVDHTNDLYGAGCSDPVTQTWKGGFSGSGAALQKRDGTLVSSFVNRDKNDVRNFHFFMSKDGGQSWYVSGTSGTTNADEPKTLERNNGDLAISVRASGYNYYNYTSDDGATWHKPAETRFTSGISGNACDGEYMVWCSKLEGNPWNIALQTLPNSGSREKVSIALSFNEGATFKAPKTICPRGSAYSAAVVLPDGTLGVYYEENGLFGGYTMRFVRFSLNWASGGLYKFTEENPFYPIKSTVTTGITDVIEAPASDLIYDLHGRRISTPTAPGIYIKNGKKVVMQ